MPDKKQKVREAISVREEEISSYEIELLMHKNELKQISAPNLPDKWPSNLAMFKKLNRDQIIARAIDEGKDLTVIFGLLDRDKAQCDCCACEVELTRCKRRLKSLKELI